MYKKCEVCPTFFNDKTKSHNKRFCSVKCREWKRNHTQERKTYMCLYQRKRRYSLRLLGKPLDNFLIGTFTQKQLDVRIEKLKEVVEK